MREGLLGPFRSWAYPRMRRSRRVKRAIAIKPKRIEIRRLAQIIRWHGTAEVIFLMLNFFFFFCMSVHLQYKCTIAFQAIRLVI